MKKVTFLISLIMTAVAQNIDAQTLSANTNTTNVTWKASKVTGSHNGTLKLKSGEVMMDGNNVRSAKIAIDMNTMTVDDIKDAGTNAKLLGHLKSDDFFSVDKFSTVNFELTKAVAKADGNGNTHFITGNLTIKGITHEISFPAAVTYANGELRAKGTLKFDRTKWDIRYNSGSFFSGLGDYMIYDDVEVGFDLVTVPN
jgi:polyisoprenoid-binding protein YceI